MTPAEQQIAELSARVAFLQGALHDSTEALRTAAEALHDATRSFQWLMVLTAVSVFLQCAAYLAGKSKRTAKVAVKRASTRED